MDKHAHQLGLANLPGATHTHVHDNIEREFFDILRGAGIHVDAEPRHIFQSLVPAAQLIVKDKPAFMPDGLASIELP